MIIAEVMTWFQKNRNPAGVVLFDHTVAALFHNATPMGVFLIKQTRFSIIMSPLRG